MQCAVGLGAWMTLDYNMYHINTTLLEVTLLEVTLLEVTLLEYSCIQTRIFRLSYVLYACFTLTCFIRV